MRAPLALVTLTATLLACTTEQDVGPDAPPDPKRGLDGNVVFFADHCFMPKCQVGPLMIGMTSKVSLSRVDKVALVDGTTAQSSAPAVATVKVIPRAKVNGVPTYGLEIQALSAGKAELTVLDAAGKPLDRLAIEARAAASFKFAQLVKVDRPRTETEPGCTGCVEEQVVETLSVEVGKASSAIYVQPFDGGGQRLEAYGEFDFGVEDTSIAKLDCLVGTCITFGQDNMSVRGVAAGTTGFFAQAGGVRSSLPVTVR